MGSSLAQVTCEASQILLAGGLVVFLRDLPFSPHLMIDLAQNESIILTDGKTHIKEIKKINV